MFEQRATARPARLGVRPARAGAPATRERRSVEGGLLWAAVGIGLVGAGVALDIGIINPWWPFSAGPREKKQDVLSAFSVRAPDWQPTLPVEQASVLPAARDVHIPVMTVLEAPPAPPAAGPSARPGAAAVQPRRSSPEGPIAFVADQSGRPPPDMIDGRMSAQAQGCALMPGQKIYATLDDAVRWDMPGQITASVTREVRSPERPENLLIPFGATLVGTANPEKLERGRDLAPSPVWQMVWWLDEHTGARIARNLQGATGARIDGVNGIGGDIDQRWGPVVGLVAATMVTDLISSVSINLGDSDTVNANIRGSSAGRILEGVAERLLDVEPIIITPKGTAMIIKPIVQSADVLTAHGP